MTNCLDHIKTFLPNSAKADRFPLITLKGVERFPYALDELGKYSTEVVEEHSIYGFNTETHIAERLKERFKFYRTDKAQHGYHLIYGELFAKIDSTAKVNILEIGLGTNNKQLISHMPSYTNPGASLRAMRDILPAAQIFGADIDKDILFTEERIQTAWVDQMNPESFRAMNARFGNPQYDLIIDDGLHAISANLNTLLFGLTVLKKNGWIMIEDIARGREVFWNTVCRLLPAESFHRFLLKSVNPYVFLLQKR
ncbi:MAG: hypothetical protein AAF798_19675 [Bacteroidota bacterium]